MFFHCYFRIWISVFYQRSHVDVSYCQGASPVRFVALRRSYKQCWSTVIWLLGGGGRFLVPYLGWEARRVWCGTMRDKYFFFVTKCSTYRYAANLVALDSRRHERTTYQTLQSLPSMRPCPIDCGSDGFSVEWCKLSIERWVPKSSEAWFQFALESIGRLLAGGNVNPFMMQNISW